MENDPASDFARGQLISQPTASSHLTKPFDVLPALAVSRYVNFHSKIFLLAMLTQWSQWTTCSEECDTRLGVTVRERACEHGMIGEDGCDESAYQSQFCNQDKPCRKSISQNYHSYFHFQHLGAPGARGQPAEKFRRIFSPIREHEIARTER